MSIQIIIRPEQAEDYPAITNLVRAAFADMEKSNQTEHLIVERLRATEAYVPQLALVATLADQLVGHIILSNITIDEAELQHPSLALGPVAVLPEYQRKGIGGLLIRQAHEEARKLGHQSVVLVGHASYYPKFGYRLCKEFDIKMPFPSPDENCMAIELVPDGLKTVKGMVKYPKAFFE